MRFKLFYFTEDLKNYKLYVDMDSVIVSWVDGFDKLSPGKTMDEWEAEGKDVEAWKLIHDAGSDWWANLPWTKDGKELWDFLKQFNPIILSSPGTQNIDIVKKGKIDWIKRELGNDVEYIIDRNKEKYADNKSILVDDMKGNIDRWEKAGGIGLLHKSTNDTIKELDKYERNNTNNRVDR